MRVLLRSATPAATLALALCASCTDASTQTGEPAASGVPGGSPWIGAGGPMFIEDCSLGCGSGQGGAPVSCTQLTIAQNEDVAVRFARHVDLTSVTPTSFRVARASDGTPAAGTFALRPGDARTLVFRPALTFDPLGNPIFGFEFGAAYEISTFGTAAGDPPPYVESIEGRPNESPMSCVVLAIDGVEDYVPGPPTAAVLVDLVDPQTGQVIPDQPAEDAVDVALDTEVTIRFDDVMNLATLVVPSTGEAPFLRIEVDPDGNLATLADRVPIEGEYAVQVDLNALETTVVFDPDGPLPSGGHDPEPRRIVVVLPPQIRDLAGNALGNFGEVAFTPEVVDYPLVVLPQPGGEPFLDSSNEDVPHSGADWGDGRLTFGHGGGAGRLGELRVGANEALVLNTELEVFPLPEQVRDLLDNSIPGFSYDPLDPSTWPTITVTDGSFEFSSVVIEEGGLLVLEGSNPGRVFSRGELVVAGVLDLAGQSALAHESNSGNDFGGGGQATALGGAGGAAGPNAGAGGKGGDRFDHTPDPEADPPNPCTNTSAAMRNAGGISVDQELSPDNPGVANDGQDGLGVGRESEPGFGAGQGGVHWPPKPPRALSPNQQPCFGDLEWTPIFNPDTGLYECRVAMVSGPGSGGAYALAGGEGIPFTPHATGGQPGIVPATPGPTAGGDASALGIELPGTVPAMVRSLDYHAGHLRGGAGGGGAGMHVWSSRNNVDMAPDADCFAQGNLFPYWDHSGAGGGGGGGAVQLVSGRALRVLGRVAGMGGDGGSSLDPDASILDCVPPVTNSGCPEFAAPGGGGSGGALKLQGLQLELSIEPATLSVAGGLGGRGVGGSLGGDGSPGLVRVEAAVGAPDPGAIAPSIEPFLPGDLSFNDPYPSAAILSVGDWTAPTLRPDSQSASVSCWMKSEIASFELDFEEDGPDVFDPDQKGWNMDVLYQTVNGVKAFPYRGIPNDPDFPLFNTDFEAFLGTLVNTELPPSQGSLFTVRFQGAKSAGTLGDPCAVDLTEGSDEIVPGTLTPWVRHPAELNEFEPRPDMVRFTVVFDRSLVPSSAVTQQIRGVTRLYIEARPD